MKAVDIIRRTLLGAVFVPGLLFICPAFGNEAITLRWEASPDPSVVGYKVCYGTERGAHDNCAGVSKVVTFTLSAASPGQTYYFVVASVSEAGILSDFSEELSTTPPFDTDGDGLFDAVELRLGTDPETVDTDGDGLSDGKEVEYGTDPTRRDSDNDGISDGEEVDFWADQWNADFDGDGIINLLDYDSDGDSFADGLEKRGLADAGDAASAPRSPYRIATGLGRYPQAGGWVETVRVDAGEVAVPKPVKRGMEPSEGLWWKLDWPEYVERNGETRVAAGDIDGDGADEMVLGLGPVSEEAAIPGGYFQLVDDDNKALGWGQVDWKEYNEANGETLPACADLDGDGKEEIVIGLGRGSGGALAVFRFDSEKGLTLLNWIALDWDLYNERIGETRPVGADIDGDGKDEILVGLASDRNDPTVPGGFFKVIDDDLTDMGWGQIQWAEYNEKNGESRLSAGDLDGDGKEDVVAGLGVGGGGSFEVLRYQDGQLPHVAWQDVTWLDYETAFEEVRPAVGNLDDDGREEILAAFGKGGGGWMQSFDDGFRDFAFVGSRRNSFEDYTRANGEGWPAVVLGVPTSCAGDLDLDGDVDSVDQQALQRALGKGSCEAGNCREDLDGDGDVDGNDLTMLQANLGRTNCGAVIRNRPAPPPVQGTTP